MRVRVLCWLLAAAFAGCATAPAPEQAAAPVDDGRSLLAQLRADRTRAARGESPAVSAELSQKLQVSPRDAQLRFLSAAVGMPSEGAWEQFKRQSTDFPQDALPQLGMAMIYTQWKMFPQANQALQQAEALKPGYLPIGLAKAQLLQAQKDPGAKAAFEALVKAADLPEAHAGLGELALDAGDVAGAKAELALAAKGDPGDLGVHRALGKLALEQHDAPAALGAFKQIVALAPQDTDALLQLAKLEESTGDVAGAQRDFMKAADARGIDLDTAQHLAVLARKTNDPKQIRTAYETLARVDKDHAAPELDLGDFLRAQKDEKGAEAAYKAALEREPKNLTAALSLARLYAQAGRTREAIEAYQALQAMPGAPAEAKSELDPLLQPLELPDKPIAGDVNRINDRFSADLQRFFKKRLKQKPHLQGKLRLAVAVDANGKVESVGLQPEGISDELLELHAYFVMKQARFPKAKRSPVFEVELRP